MNLTLRITFILFMFLFLISISLIPKKHFQLEPQALKEAENIHKSNDNQQTQIEFKEASFAWKLIASHNQSSKYLTGINEIMGSGACILDVDGDGWHDLFLVGGGGEHRFYGHSSWWTKSNTGNTLWRNINGKKFTDTTTDSQISTAKWPMGCAVADFDNDGDSDLFITNIGSNQLLINNGFGKFVDRSKEAGLLKNNSWSMSAAVADYNQDGLVDIYVSNFIHYQKGAKVFEQASGYLGTEQQSFDARLYESQANHLYTNKGNLKFEENATSLGTDDATGKGLGALWLDINGDHWMDLIVLNSAGTSNRLYINGASYDNAGEPQGIAFTEASKDYRIENSAGAHSAVSADINNNGSAEVIISSPTGIPPKLLMKNNFAITNSTSSLTDLTWELGIADNLLLYQQGWGAVLADFNNDQHLDLFIGNGAPTIDLDSSFVTVSQPDSLWINNGSQIPHALSSTHFTPMSFAANTPSPTRGVITADFNHDGKVDVVTTQNNDFVKLLINESDTKQPWIGITLDSTGYPSLGARIQIKTDEALIDATHAAKSSYLSQSTEALHFALPNGSETVDVTVLWSNGQQKKYAKLSAGLYWYLGQKGSSIPLPQRPLNKAPASNAMVFLSALTTKNQIEFIKAIGRIEQYSDDYRSERYQSLIEELSFIFSGATDEFKYSMLTIAPKIPAGQALHIVSIGLNDSNSQVRKAAINTLKHMEQEVTVRWLITRLKDNDAEVQCAAADTFEHFFREEEAVIERKRLATPALTQLLDHVESSVQICAAKALAESESYRAIAPLTKALLEKKENQSTLVRIEIIRALGLVRHRDAIKPLLEVMQQFEENSAVIASGLIALKRLDYDKLDTLLYQYLYTDVTTQISQQFSVATELLNSVEGSTVFSQEEILSYFSSLIHLLQKDRLRSDDQVIKTLNLLARFQAPETKATLLHFLSHPNSTFSTAALMALATTAKPKNGLHEWRFYTFNDHTQSSALSELLNQGYQPSVNDARKILGNTDTAKIFIAHINRYGYSKIISLLSTSPALTKPHSAALLIACIEQTQIDDVVLTNWFTSDTETHKPQLIDKLRCWLRSTPDRQTSPDIQWLVSLTKTDDMTKKSLAIKALAKHPDSKANNILIQLIRDPSHEMPMRILALRWAVRHKKTYALEIAFKLANQEKSALRDEAIALIEAHGEKPKLLNFLSIRAKNKTFTADQRLRAIKALSDQSRNKILDYVFL